LEYAQAENARIFAGTEPEAGYDALAVEHDNLRAALDWATAWDRIDDEIALAVALRQFWLVRGHLGEGRGRFGRLVARLPADAGAIRAPALTHGASFAYRQGDLATAKAWWNEALELNREAGDAPEIGRCLGELGSVALAEGDLDLGQRLYEEAAALFE